MHRIDRWLIEWADDVIRRAYSSELSSVNIVERLLRDPGMASDSGKDRVLFWHRNPRIASVSRAAYRLDTISQIILIIHYGYLPYEGRKFTLKDLAKNSSMTLGEISAKRRDARRKLQYEINKHKKN